MDMRMKMLSILLAALLITVTAAMQVQAATHTVSMKNMAFVPKEITIAAGDTVTWVNNDPLLHDVDLGSRGESPDMGKGGTYSMTFDRTGRYDYDCDLHPGMTGAVIVR
jgi:plastocyanin